MHRAPMVRRQPLVDLILWRLENCHGVIDEQHVVIRTPGSHSQWHSEKGTAEKKSGPMDQTERKKRTR